MKPAAFSRILRPPTKRDGTVADAPAAAPPTELERRREELRASFSEIQWDLGGLAYEMAARDHFRIDVLAAVAARLQVVDAELSEVERLARLEHAGAGGSCPSCGSLHAHGAIYCWRCGRDLTDRSGGHAAAGQSALAPPAADSTPMAGLVEGG